RSPRGRRRAAWLLTRVERAVRRAGPARLIVRKRPRDLIMSETQPARRCPGPQPFHPRSRSEFLRVAGCGFGLLGLADLLARDRRAASPSNPLAPRPGHFPTKAKRCIFLFMTGGPSQMDLFAPKPLLNRLDGQPLPPSFGKIHSQFLENDP